MSQHTHVTTEGEIFAVGDNRDEYVGCIGTCPGEPAEVTEARWNRFAQTMWDYGVEPTEDEPVYSITEDEVVYDHYLLRMIHPIQNHIGKIAGALVAASAVATTFADRTAMLMGTFLNHAA